MWGAEGGQEGKKNSGKVSESEECDKDGERGGKCGRGDGRGYDDEVREGYEEGAVGGVRRVHSESKISAAEANGSYYKLHF